MIKSMTAFARSSFEADSGTLSWEIKSLNHRYLEIYLRLPEALKPLDVKIRELIQKNIARGKLEVSLSFQQKKNRAESISINPERVQAIISACNEIEMLAGVGQAVNPLDILSYPGVIEETVKQAELADADLEKSLAEVLSQLNRLKAEEGERLKHLVLDRAKKLRDIVQTIRKRMPDVRAAMREKLEQKLAELNAASDENRLEQELVYMAQKLDIDEELDRLISHVVSLQSALDSDEAVGRRLDFLMQEFNREANTIASKSADTATTRDAVEMKVLIEQMREQVQNIE